MVSTLDSGEYGQPLLRNTLVNCIVYGSGTQTVTNRMEAVNLLGAPDENKVMAVIENVGDTTFSMRLQETDSYVSGPRTSVGGSSHTLAPRGRKSIVFNATKRYLEVNGLQGQGRLRMQMASRVRWNELAFAKTDTVAAPILWQPDNIPLLSELDQ